MNTVNQDRSAAARELLDFYAAAGVDAALGEIAVDRLAPAQAPPPEVTTAARQTAPSPPPRAEPPQRAPGRRTRACSRLARHRRDGGARGRTERGEPR